MEPIASQTRPTATGDAHRLDDEARCLVVMYHYVRPGPIEPNDGIRGLTAAAFSDQLACLCRQLEPITWAEFCSWKGGRGTIPRRSFLVTFDDGLSDHFFTVVPTLEEFGISGTFFVPGAVLESPVMLPAHRIHLLLRALGTDGMIRELREAWPALGLAGAFPDTGADEQVQQMYGYENASLAGLKYTLTMTLPIDTRNKLLESIFANHVGDEETWSRRWYLGWNHLVHMQSLGHTIGGHGFSHEPLTRLTPVQRDADVSKSFAILEDGLGSARRPFSYPYGCVDEGIVGSCSRSGFEIGYTTQSDWCLAGHNALESPRVDTIHVGAALKGLQLCP